MVNPLVSVILCMHNEEKYVVQAVKSILNQTYVNFELIIIDDYSTDSSVSLCVPFVSQKVVLHVKTNEARNLASSRNLGVSIAKGDYIIYQDADDISEPNRIEKLIDCVNQKGKMGSCIGSAILEVNGPKRSVKRYPCDHDSIIKGFSRLTRRATIHATTVLYPRWALLEFPYRPRFKYAADWDQLLRMHESKKVDFYNIKEPVYRYFIREKGVVWRSDWPDYNVWIRNCQKRRAANMEEYESLEGFLESLKERPIIFAYWHSFRLLIKLNVKLRGIFSALLSH